MKTDALYELKGVVVDYATAFRLRGVPAPAPALEIPSLSILEGRTTALLGPNGSGKTTLLKLLNGLVRPRAGSCLYRGEDAARSDRLRAETVYLHQAPYIMAGSVSYNVAFGARSRGLPRGEAARLAARAMEDLGLSGFGRRGHRALSGGEAQRVGLARALATGSRVFLLDEPTASVDAASRGLVIEAIRALSENGATVILSTHDPTLADLLGARVVALEPGRVIGERSPHEPR